MKHTYLAVIISLLFYGCSVKIGSDNKVEATAGGVTVQSPPIPPGVLGLDWCKYIPPQYKHYFPECSAPAGSPDAALTKPVVAALYSTAANWNDYIKADGSAVCAGTETTYNGCLNGGELRQAVTAESSCSGLSLADSEGVFNWTCSVIAGSATFTSQLKITKGLQHLISNTSFIPMYVTLTKGAQTINSDTTTWWSNTIQTLPNNSTTGASVSSLNGSGTIYVTSSNINTSGYNITADKVSIVTLAGSGIYHNATTGTNAHLDGSVGNDARTVIATGGHKYLWIEGLYDMNGATSGGAWTVFLSNTKLSKLHLMESHRGYPLYLYQSSYNTLESITLADSIDFGMQLDTSNGNAVLNSVSINNAIHYGMGVGNSNNNYVYNFKSDSSFGGVRLFSGSQGNVFDQMLFTNVQAGIYAPDVTVANYISNVTISAVSGGSTHAAILLQNSNNQVLSNLLIDGFAYGISFNTAHSTLLSNLKLSNEGYGLYSYDGASTAISGEMFYLTNTHDCLVAYGGSAGFSSSCVAAGSSTFTVVTSSSNVFGYQL